MTRSVVRSSILSRQKYHKYVINPLDVSSRIAGAEGTWNCCEATAIHIEAADTVRFDIISISNSSLVLTAD